MIVAVAKRSGHLRTPTGMRGKKRGAKRAAGVWHSRSKNRKKTDATTDTHETERTRKVITNTSYYNTARVDPLVDRDGVPGGFFGARFHVHHGRQR